MKTYIISLKNAHERRRYISHQASSSGIDFEIIDAVNGKEITENMLQILAKDYSYAITPGEIGCTLSHLIAYKQLLVSGNEFALILEDDVLIPENLADTLHSLKKNMTKDKPCVYLLSKVNHYNSKKLSAVSNTASIHEVYNAAFSHAYIINRKAAQKLLENLFPVWCVADQWTTFREFGLVQLYGVIPACIHTNPEFESITTIENRGRDETKKAKAEAWKKTRAARPLSIKIAKTFDLLFNRPFQKIIKQ